MTYAVNGQIFFASTESLMNAFDFHDDVQVVVLDFSRARLWDESAATTLRKIIRKFESTGKKVQVQGMDESSKDLVSNLYGVRNDLEVSV